ncbi:MAG: AraC family transcriptional regulator [Eubacteriales bacterium]|nr:AraC family transcriptional regulator [Eubacteriales bacterium]MDD4474319.1 AraC family transcriptional regulator [Eubacteriales bacterium]
MSISNKIAKCVGYDDPLYFSRVFYKNINITPSDYRRME